MEDEPDTDVENGSVPPTLSNLLTLADHQGDDDEKTNEGMSDGDHDDGDSISTRSEEKTRPTRSTTSFSISLKAILLYHRRATPSQAYGN